MKVVVTGASGFLGQAVVRRLRALAVDVAALARRKAPGTLRVADYADAPAADVLVHLAESNDRQQLRDAGEGAERAASRTLAALHAKPYRRVVYASSAVLYGDVSPTPHRADAPVDATDTYTRIKQEGERAVLERRGVAARLTNVYGPGMSEANVLSAILRQIPGSGPLRVLDAAPVRDFIFVDDAAAALAAMALGEAGGVFNVGTGLGTSILTLAQMALEVAGEPERGVVSTTDRSRPSTLIVDTDATRSAFAWRPTVPLRAGLARLVSVRGAFMSTSGA